MTHMTFHNPVARPQITAGLRALADYLDAHPAVPVPPYGWDLAVSTHLDSDPDGTAEIDRIAAILGTGVCDRISDGGHYTTTRVFGPVTYTAFHIPVDQTDTGADDSQQAA